MVDVGVKDYLNEVKEIGKKYDKIINDFNFSYPKAENLQDEKRKFFSAIADDKIYNPKISFSFPERNYDVIEELENFGKTIDLNNDYYNLKKLYSEIVDVLFLFFN